MPDATPIKVFLSCTGVDLFRGGHETFARECYDGLRGTPGLDIILLKSTPPDNEGERRVWCLGRTGRSALALGKWTGRSGYAIEQNSSVPGILRLIRRERPDVFFTSEANLLSRLHSSRKLFGKPVGLMISNGAPYTGPFTTRALDQVHQVTPAYFDSAVSRGDPTELHTLVPYGFTIPPGEPDRDPAKRRALRRELKLPEDRTILISVGWVSPTHKRMDHLVREIARLPADKRPFVLMMGRTDESTPIIEAAAREQLGSGNYEIRSVPYEKVAAHLDAADLFALCSLNEGFGRAFVEALSAGIPVLTHDHPVMRFVNAEVGDYCDMTREGDLARLVSEVMARPVNPGDPARRRSSVRDRFGWPALRTGYLDMFKKAAARAAARARD